MRKEEAIKYIEEWLKDEYSLSSKDIIVLTMAIEALNDMAERKDEPQTNADQHVQHVESVDLISRQDAIEALMNDPDWADAIPTIKSLPSAEAEDRLYIKIYADDEPSVMAEKLYQICDETQNGEVAEWLKEYFPSTDRPTEWIPFTKRPLTDEEKEEYPDWIYIFDCPLPDDGQEILLSNGKYVWTDTFFNDDGCYLDGGDDIDEGMAWMPLPEPYREDGEEE